MALRSAAGSSRLSRVGLSEVLRQMVTVTASP